MASHSTPAAHPQARSVPGATPPAHFSPEALAFLNDLAANNERTWFTERKDFFLGELREPMLAVIDSLDGAFEHFAPQYTRPPEKAMMRIYRDVRFAKDKTPYKTQLAASFPRHGQEKTGGAVLYFHLTPREVFVAGAAYSPAAPELLLIREHLLEHHERYRELVRSLPAEIEPLDGRSLIRAPRGFDAEHPAIDLLRQRRWGASATLPVSVAFAPDFATQLAEKFEALVPLVEFLNEAMAAGSERHYSLE